jgi:G3E family GTPase
VIAAVTLVVGQRGVGKTRTVLDSLADRAPGRWAYLVNDVGRTQVDPASWAERGVAVRAVAGGCACCVGAVALRVALVQALRTWRPDHLLVELDAAARPDAVLAALRAPGLAESVAVRGVVCLVHPHVWGSSGGARVGAAWAQVSAANALAPAAGASSAERVAFAEVARTQWPSARAYPDGCAALRAVVGVPRGSAA